VSVATRPQLSHLRALESEAIHVMREVAAEFERPVLLFSGGKDSIVLLRLAEKAFRPAPFPFPLMHVDTEHNFPEVIEFRDRRVAELGERWRACRTRSTAAARSRRRGRGHRATSYRR
jgi:sulfate adenylyltransferase subunit 2